ncbi:hypothetical protein [Bosea sp. ANAM02]|uniref:hypothetical protein n=1 Tax=Bosea sp. ANAM02 TaxID=2020412 RepID=UPI00140EEF84|nr:hypothetical protein [Bosea sp. ANAM02]BCB17788.1 hypothetical protein OCUBac02_06820 [Bosea sp. ANAM02]
MDRAQFSEGKGAGERSRRNYAAGPQGERGLCNGRTRTIADPTVMGRIATSHLEYSFVEGQVLQYCPNRERDVARDSHLAAVLDNFSRSLLAWDYRAQPASNSGSAF